MRPNPTVRAGNLSPVRPDRRNERGRQQFRTAHCVPRANRSAASDACILVHLFPIELTPAWHPCILRMWNCCSDAQRPSSSLSRLPPLDGPSARAGRPRPRRAWPAARAMATVRCTDPPNRAQALRELSRRPKRTAAAPHPARTTRRHPLWPSPFRCLQRWCPARSRPWRRSWRRRRIVRRVAHARAISRSVRSRSTSCSPSSSSKSRQYPCVPPPYWRLGPRCARRRAREVCRS